MKLYHVTIRCPSCPITKEHIYSVIAPDMKSAIGLAPRIFMHKHSQDVAPEIICVKYAEEVEGICEEAET